MIKTILVCGAEEPKYRRIDTLIRLTRTFNASDIRDRIYALRGLAPEEDRGFPIDYFKPPDAVFRDFVRYNINHNHNLGVLLGARLYNPNVAPSWLPDLTDFCPYDIVARWTDSPFKASGLHPCSVSFRDSDRVLSARGVTVDVVEEVIGSYHHLEIPRTLNIHNSTQLDEGSLTKITNTLDLAEKIKGVIQRFTPEQKQCVWKSLSMNVDISSWQNEYPAPESWESMHRIWLQEEPLPEDFMPQMSQETRVEAFCRQYLTSVSTWSMSNRCFFTTSNQMMGNGPYGTKAGDIVVVLLGCMYCIVLRSVDTSFRLVGDAYVHGIMNGEFLKGKAKADFRTFDIV